MGSPWSPPAWMKSNRKSIGGSLKPEFYGAYAKYFVKYIQGMKAEGIRIDAITVQNEPLHPGNNPSLLMQAPEQAKFIRNHLGPAFKQAGLNTKIIIYDHNCDRPDYPISILNDADARKYVDGTAFHLYAGKIDAVSAVHEAHPDKNLYFTEQWIGAPGNLRGDLAWHTRELIDRRHPQLEPHGARMEPGGRSEVSSPTRQEAAPVVSARSRSTATGSRAIPPITSSLTPPSSSAPGLCVSRPMSCPRFLTLPSRHPAGGWC